MQKSKLFLLVAAALVLGTVFLPALASAAPTKIVMLWDYRENYKEWQQETADKFMQENPDIQIELIDAAGQTQQKIKTMVAAGAQLDIAYYDAYLINQWGEEGLAADLSSYVAKEKRFNNWYPAGFQLFSTKGATWALPRDLQLEAMYYNVDAYEEAGLAKPMKWTYEDVKDNALKLQEKDSEGKITRWGWKYPTWRNWMTVAGAFGARFVDSWNEPTKFTGNTTEMAAFLRYTRELEETGAIIDNKSEAALYDYKSYINAFTKQFSTMILGNSIALFSYMDIKDFTWDVAPLPSGPAGVKPFFNAMGWFMLESCENKDAAWKVMNYFTNEAAMESMVSRIGVIPPDRRFVQQWVGSLTKPQSRAVFFGDLTGADFPGSLNNDVYKAIFNELKAVRFGDIPVGNAIENMNTTVNAAIQELNQGK